MTQQTSKARIRLEKGTAIRAYVLLLCSSILLRHVKVSRKSHELNLKTLSQQRDRESEITA